MLSDHFRSITTKEMGRDSLPFKSSGNEQYLESVAEIQAFLLCKFLILIHSHAFYIRGLIWILMVFKLWKGIFLKPRGGLIN